MRKYTQLTRGKRYQIRALLKACFSQSEMAFFLKVHKSTISREIRRNKGDKGYRGPMQPRGDLPRIKLDLTTDEIVVLGQVIREVHHPYSST